MRQLFAVLALIALSCSPPPERPCDRFQVGPDGTVAGFAGGFAGGGFAGGFGGGVGNGGGFNTPINLEGEAISLRMVAPLTSCPSDTLRASVEVLAPDSTILASVSTAPLRAGDTHVETRVDFTPPTPGLYVVRAVFEPSLGVRTQTLNILSTFKESQGTPITLPSGVTCSKSPWALSQDTIACEHTSGQISLISADAGVLTFSGSALVVADNVLWTETSTHTLERREWADGGLSLTGSVQGFAAEPVRGLHTRTTAIRRRDNGLLGALLPDGGLFETSFTTTDYESGLFFFEPNELTLRVANSFACGNCLNSLVGFDDATAWQQFGSGSIVNGFKRPITVMTPFMTPAFMLQIEARATTPPLEPLERWPLWIDPSARPTTSVLVRPHAGALEWSAWPRGRVVRVGSRFAVLTTQTGFLVAPLDR